MNKKMTVLIGCLIALFLVNAPSYGGDRQAYYEVTVTNVTHGQHFTPLIVVTHRGDARLFTPGDPASEELAMLAEGGATDPLAERLTMNPDVGSIETSGGLLGPGETVTVSVPAVRGFRQISLAGMLLPTNDGFVALNSVKAPSRHRMKGHIALAYDAGSEENSESCVDIPGPFGCDGTGAGYSEADGEGFVHIHAGIQGNGDLDTAEFDWRNPVAIVLIRHIVERH